MRSGISDSSLPLQIEADVRGIDPNEPAARRVVRGQVAVATTRGVVEQIRLVPAEPPASAEVLAAISEADWLIFGPGSWFTSVLPHFLVPELRAAIAASGASRMLILNLTGDEETIGLSTADLLRSLSRHAPEFRADVVIADPTVTQPTTSSGSIGPDPIDAASIDPSLAEATESLGARLMVTSVARNDGTRGTPRTRSRPRFARSSTPGNLFSTVNARAARYRCRVCGCASWWSCVGRLVSS